MFQRLLNPLKTNSFFIFGARGTGKSTLIQKLLPQRSYYIDLLEPRTELLYRRSPERLEALVRGLPRDIDWIIIDEVQKVPTLLDLVHRLIEGTEKKFALTGSSARKLKRGGANLLAGRAFVYHLFPLTQDELGANFDLEYALTWGTLPRTWALTLDEERKLFLETYVHTYLKEEVIAEQLVRSVDPFNRFLEVAAQCSGDTLNFSSIARDVGSDSKTIQVYFQILQDTLVGIWLPAYHRSVRKKQSKAPKFYLFDCGVRRALDGALLADVKPWGNERGRLFEQFVIVEIYRLNSYLRRGYQLSHFRTKEGVEVDLIIERPRKNPILVEIKATETVREDHVKPLQLLANEFRDCEFYCLSLDLVPQRFGDVQCLHWIEGIKQIGLSSAATAAAAPSTHM